MVPNERRGGSLSYLTPTPWWRDFCQVIAKTVTAEDGASWAERSGAVSSVVRRCPLSAPASFVFVPQYIVPFVLF